MNTLKVPAALYDEALRFCNARLAEDGKPPIDALPAGIPNHMASCPCGAACGVIVGDLDWKRPGGGCSVTHQHPTRFVMFFDTNAQRHVLNLPVRDETAPAP